MHTRRQMMRLRTELPAFGRNQSHQPFWLRRCTAYRFVSQWWCLKCYLNHRESAVSCTLSFVSRSGRWTLPLLSSLLFLLISQRDVRRLFSTEEMLQATTHLAKIAADFLTNPIFAPQAFNCCGKVNERTLASTRSSYVLEAIATISWTCTKAKPLLSLIIVTSLLSLTDWVSTTPEV